MLKVTNVAKTTIKKTIGYLGSSDALYVVKVAAALITLFHTIDEFKTSRRKIGFKQ